MQSMYLQTGHAGHVKSTVFFNGALVTTLDMAGPVQLNNARDHLLVT